MKWTNRRHTLVQVKKTTFADAAGGAITETDSLVCKEWVALRPATSREIDEAHNVGEEITHKVQMRYSPVTAAITAKDHFLLLGTRTLEIASSPRNIDERNTIIEFDCKERP